MSHDAELAERVGALWATFTMLVALLFILTLRGGVLHWWDVLGAALGLGLYHGIRAERLARPRE